MTKSSFRAFSLLVPLAAWGCASHRPDYHGLVPGQADVVDLLREAETRLTDPEASMEAAPLASAPGVNHQLLRIRGAEPLHRHENHDLTIVILRGGGVLRTMAGEREREEKLGVGSIVLIPRGLAHAFRNEEEGTTIAFMASSPPFDPADRVLLEK